MQRPEQPPPIEFFARRRPAAGERRFALRIGPLEVELAGLAEEHQRSLRERFERYAAQAASGDDALRVAVGCEQRDYFIDPRPGELNQIRIASDGERIRYLGYRTAGWFDLAQHRGELLLGRGEYEPARGAIENFLRAAVAWLAAGRGGALVHGASAVWNGQAYLFFGPSGAGKSTLAACNRRALVVSDDLSVLLPDARGALELVGSPFRGTYEAGEPVIGRFPLRAAFRLVQNTRADVRSVDRARAFAELVGNLPFVAEAFSARADLFEGVQRAFASVPLEHLHFTRDDSYWDAIAAAGYA